MYKKYNKINDLAYIKRKVKIAKFHLTSQDYTLKRQKKWNKRNKKKYLSAIKNAIAKKPEYYRTYKTRRYKKDPIFKLCTLVRCRTRSLFKQSNWKKNKRFKEYIGCSPKELAEHIESQFKGNMTWKNHGTYWELDHIVAIGLNSKTPEDVYRLNHYSNLQPLTIKQHKKKTKKDIKRK